jgi:starvation-inducible DNA-binding protein
MNAGELASSWNGGKAPWKIPVAERVLRASIGKTLMVKTKHSTNSIKAAPILNQRSKPIQEFGTVIRTPIGLEEKVLVDSTNDLNQLLADTIMLRDLYKKHHWQVSGHTFYQLHLLFDKHYAEQNELVDQIAERIQSLGGITVAVAHDVAEHTRLERPPIHREEVPVQISRLLESHEIILKEAREYAKAASERGDDGTNDLIVSGVIRINEMQVWFLSEHLVDVPVVEAD